MTEEQALERTYVPATEYFSELKIKAWNPEFQNYCPAVDRGRTTTLVKFNNRAVRILKEHCTCGRFAEHLVMPHQNYCRSCLDVKETESMQYRLQSRRHWFLLDRTF